MFQWWTGHGINWWRFNMFWCPLHVWLFWVNFHVQPGLSPYWPIPDLADASKILKKKEFPKMGVPLKIIHFNRMFPYKPSIFGYPFMETPKWESRFRIPTDFLLDFTALHAQSPSMLQNAWESRDTPRETHQPCILFDWSQSHKPQYICNIDTS